MDLTKEEKKLIHDALTGRYIMFMRSGETSDAKKYDKLRERFEGEETDIWRPKKKLKRLM